MTAQSVDLQETKNRLARKKGLLWRITHNIDGIERDYRQFLQRKIDDPSLRISPPSQAVDDLWHEHILDTKKYFEDCNELFGYYLHHIPADGACDTCQGGCSDGGFCHGSCY